MKRKQRTLTKQKHNKEKRQSQIDKKKNNSNLEIDFNRIFAFAICIIEFYRNETHIVCTHKNLYSQIPLDFLSI